MKPMIAVLTMIAAALQITLATAQDLPFPERAANDEAALSAAIPELARATLASGAQIGPADRFRLQLGAGQYAEALATLSAWRERQPPLASGQFDPTITLELFAKTKALEASEAISFAESFARVFAEVFGRFDDATALEAGWFVATPLTLFEGRLQRLLLDRKEQGSIAVAKAIALVRASVDRDAMRNFAPLLSAALAADDANRYLVDENVLIKTKEGVTLSALIVRKKGITGPQPTILGFNIYVNLELSKYEAKLAAVHGYVGVAADPRGKRLSPDRIAPWEHEAADTYAIFDWISTQPWSNAQIGMYGHSYSGFATWAAANGRHPALKTIVALSASQPGLGMPMQNNVFQLAQYAWPFYVMNNKYTDDAIYFDLNRWSALQDTWFASGRPFREIDAIDGLPNPLFQRQLQHASFDAYYQAMQPYRQDYRRIDIPVLSIAGYYDDANPSTVDYVREHYKYNARADHFLVIGPYEHGATWRPVKPGVVRGYEIEPAARFDSVALRFEWFDHILRGAARPALVQDRINYQVMGANRWSHAPSIERMSNAPLTLYLTDTKVDEHYRLAPAHPKEGRLTQTVDFADRKVQNNLYPMRAIEAQVGSGNGFTFISDPFEEAVSFDGQLSGQLTAAINKKDFDFSLALYELMPDGRYFYLSYYVGRASYAADMSKRRLLTPGKLTRIPFDRTPLISRQLSRGSRLVLLLTVNKNAHAQVNYGTGKDVSDESIEDAKEPLQVHWHTDSFVKLPLTRVSAELPGIPRETTRLNLIEPLPDPH